MNRQTHLLVGIVLFLLCVYGTGLIHHTSGESLILGCIAVLAGSLFPDIIEPPASAKHRGFFHSRRMLKAAAVLFLITALAVMLAPGMPRFPLASSAFTSSGFFLGYATHLAADSLTRAGLPG